MKITFSKSIIGKKVGYLKKKGRKDCLVCNYWLRRLFSKIDVFEVLLEKSVAVKIVSVLKYFELILFKLLRPEHIKNKLRNN